MGLTPLDIHNKEFSRSLRGYNPDEVDEFLDEIIDEFEKLYRESLDMQDKIDALIDQTNSYKTIEKTLNETLVTAQQTAEDVIATGQQKADLIVNQAEDRAKEIVDEANKQVINIKQEYDDIKRQMEIFKNKFKILLNTQLEMLNSEELASKGNMDKHGQK